MTRSICLLAALAIACGDVRVQGTTSQLTVSPASLDFGAVALGSDNSKQVTLTNNGRTRISVSKVASSMAFVVTDEEQLSLEAGQSLQLTLRYQPMWEGPSTGEVAFESDAENALALAVSGRAVRVQLEVAPKALDFHDVELSSFAEAPLTLENPSEIDLTVHGTLEGVDADAFSFGQAEVTLPARGSVRLPLTFTPRQLGGHQATARLLPCAACEPILASLNGSGISSLIEVRPLKIAFGRVAPGTVVELPLTVTNQGAAPIALGGFVWGPGAAKEFSVSFSGPQQLGVGQTARATVSFAPAGSGPVAASLLEVAVPTRSGRGIRVPVTGEGGPPCLVATPSTLDFGLVPQGATARKKVELLNRCTDEATVDSLALSTSLGGFFTVASQPMVVPAGARAPIWVTFVPKPGAPRSEAILSLDASQKGARSVLAVGITGSSRTVAPCQLTLSPTSLDFGQVQVGETVKLGLLAKNVGSDLCFFSALSLASGSDDSFSLTPFETASVDPGKSLVVEPAFAPKSPGLRSGLLNLEVNVSGAPPSVLLAGEGVNSCLAIAPATVDFGATPLSCGPRTRSVSLTNLCPVGVTIYSATIAQATSSELSWVSSSAPFPLVVAAGAPASLSVSYTPVDDGRDAAALRLGLDGGGFRTVGLSGEGRLNGQQVDHFSQEVAGKADILFVIDNSGSMSEEQAALAQNVDTFIAAAQTAGIDFQVGITTTGIQTSPGAWSACPGGAVGGEAGRLFPVDGTSPRIVAPSTPNLLSALATNLKVGICHWDEQGLEAMYRALSAPLVDHTDDPRTTTPNDGNAGFLRSDARLLVIAVSDEEDSSPLPVSSYLSFLQGLKADPSMVTFSAVVGPQNLATCPTATSSGSRYLEMVQATGGVSESICTANWSSSLQTLASQAFAPRRAFRLSSAPRAGAPITVKVNGVAASNWSYEPATQSVVFDQGHEPPAGASVEVSYALSC